MQPGDQTDVGNAPCPTYSSCTLSVLLSQLKTGSFGQPQRPRSREWAAPSTGLPIGMLYGGYLWPRTATVAEKSNRSLAKRQMRQWSPRARLATYLRCKLIARRIKERSWNDKPVNDGPTLTLRKQANSLTERQKKKKKKKKNALLHRLQQILQGIVNAVLR